MFNQILVRFAVSLAARCKLYDCKITWIAYDARCTCLYVWLGLTWLRYVLSFLVLTGRRMPLIWGLPSFFLLLFSYLINMTVGNSLYSIWLLAIASLMINLPPTQANIRRITTFQIDRLNAAFAVNCIKSCTQIHSHWIWLYTCALCRPSEWPNLFRSIAMQHSAGILEKKKTGTPTNYHTLWMVWFGWLNRCVDRQFDGDVCECECVHFFAIQVIGSLW